MIFLICGSRDWTDKDTITDTLISVLWGYDLENEVSIIHGDARGADRLGAEVAREQRVLPEFIFARPANWDKYGKQAGRLRNLEMLCEAMQKSNLSSPTPPQVDDVFPGLMVLAFYKGDFSPGTQMMINYARQFGVEVKVVYG